MSFVASTDIEIENLRLQQAFTGPLTTVSKQDLATGRTIHTFYMRMRDML